jgi:serine/threonine protein kinase
MIVGLAEFRGTERFQLLSRLGEGGMGVVYKALDRQLEARVALKTMRLLSGDAVLRFKNEFRALQDIQHPNLISLGELICEGSQWFFTMELVDGVDFRAWVRGTEDGPDDFSRTTPEEPRTDVGTAPGMPASRLYDPQAASASFDEARLRAALGQLADGLHALHGAGKVHRDIKPSNILVTFEGRVVVLDFGLATDVAARELSDPHAVGTVDYMAPEQAAARPVGPEADWYSVGVLLYEALTGRLPFVGAPLQVMMDKQEREPPPPSALVAGVPEDLDRLCG